MSSTVSPPPPKQFFFLSPVRLPTLDYLLVPHLCLEQAARGSRRRARATEVLNPGSRVELGVDSVELPSSGTDLAVVGARLDRLQDGDTLGGEFLDADLGDPSENDDAVAGHDVSTQDGKADRGLRALATDEGLGVGEGESAQRHAGDVVDRVGCVSERRGKEVRGNIGAEVGQGGDELGLDANGGSIGNTAVSWVATSGDGGSGRSQADQADRGDDAGETHFDGVS